MINDLNENASRQEQEASTKALLLEKDFFVKSEPAWKLLNIDILPRSVYDFVKSDETHALIWLARELGVSTITLLEILGKIRSKRFVYCMHVLRKKNGGKRIALEPFPELMAIQEKIKNLLTERLPVDKNVHGFSQGNVLKALEPHLKSTSWMIVDIKDAFPSIKYHDILEALTLKSVSIYIRDPKEGYFSWYVSRMLCQLCTHNNILPQGAPSSPRLFDIAFSTVDETLKMLTGGMRLVYTRYADNLFFSKKNGEITNNEKWQILRAIEGEWRKKLKLGWHKLKIVHSCSQAIRMLGLNLIEGKLHNTRAFKLRLRLLVHHIEWLKRNGMDYWPERQQLAGMWGFAVKSSLPKKLSKKIRKIIKNK